MANVSEYREGNPWYRSRPPAARFGRPAINSTVGMGTCRQTGCDRWPSRYSCHPRHAVSGAPRTVWHNMIQKSAIFQRNCL